MSPSFLLQRNNPTVVAIRQILRYLYLAVGPPWHQHHRPETTTLGDCDGKHRRNGNACGKLPEIDSRQQTRLIPALQSYREGAFTGYFGCIGVSAVFYVQVALENIPEEREHLRAVITPVVYFMVLTSVIVHGMLRK